MGRLEEIQKELDKMFRDENVKDYIALTVEKEVLEKKIDNLRCSWEYFNDCYNECLKCLSEEIVHEIVETEDGYAWERYETDDYVDMQKRCEENWVKRRDAEKKLKEFGVEL